MYFLINMLRTMYILLIIIKDITCFLVVFLFAFFKQVILYYDLNLFQHNIMY